MNRPARSARFANVVIRVGIMAVLWLALAAGETGSLLIPLAAIALATVLSFRLLPPGPHGVDLAAVLSFIPYFIGASLRGGADVAHRALSEAHVPEAGIFGFDTRIPDGLPRYLFIGMIGLFPGSIAIGVEGDTIQIHALASRARFEPLIRDLELRIMRIFRLT